MDESENPTPDQPGTESTEAPRAAGSSDGRVQRLRAEAQATLNALKGEDGILGLFNFKKMYFPFFAHVLFIVYCVGIALGGLVLAAMALYVMFSRSFLDGLMGVFMSGVFVVASIILGRIWIELIMVAFNINDAVQDIRDMLRAKWQ